MNVKKTKSLKKIVLKITMSMTVILSDLLPFLKAGRLIELVSNDDELFIGHSSRLSKSGSS